MTPQDHPAPEPFPVPTVSAASPALNEATVIGEEMSFTGTVAVGDRPKVSALYIWLMVLATFGAMMALVAPIGYSLSVLVSRIAPGHDEYLGYVTGVGSLVVVLLGPIIGILSDRTRSRFGRRRPWLLGLTLIGLTGLVIVATAPNIGIAIAGWAVTQFGFGIAALQLTSSLGDRLPESQRGKVAGLNGVAVMVAPIFGVVLASAFAGTSLLLFLVPGIPGAILILLFVIFIKEPDGRGFPTRPKASVRSFLAGYGYNVKKYPDFSWNWLGRFTFNFGVTMATTFTTFFFASKLGIPVDEIGGIIAITALVGIAATVGGAALSGFLSDRLKRRKSFIVVAGLLFAAGTTVSALAPDFTLLMIGLFAMNLGLGIFSAVDGALMLDVLPEQDTEAGRFVAIAQFSTSIPQFAAPLFAPVVLLWGASAGESNYPLLYVVAGVLALIGGLIILFKVKSVR
ncbi:MFS transporter [Microbacterium sp. PRC9]|uniref:MFS transporter n=1 Tax=Microbacterium sp. PRC9 TaxID=2962591 RepID=UPI002881009D|nr:MFS transporter [Microbacterium sp. PRC9]MDT0144561.1 MFS transporter [Microbacterium sp. PRC9]